MQIESLKNFGWVDSQKFSFLELLSKTKGFMHIYIDTTFRVGSEAQAYLLHVGGFSGTTVDSLTKYNNGARFSTLDRDRDTAQNFHCAQHYRGAWWYSR